ncbi:MAG TPA: amino acid adenylation domain-containing protein [Anaerolineales bacterium]|nr:amino acid adenylation domain-containing protein [Anaerolineales bacterium]
MTERGGERVPPSPSGSGNILRQPTGSRFPLSYSQERLWFMDQLHPGSIAYNRPWAVRLTGPLDFDCLSRSVNEIIRRHAVLRTTFPAVGGIPMQQVNEFRPLKLPLIDLSETPDDSRQSEAVRIACQISIRPFDLARDMIIRPYILRLEEDQHVLLLTTHHIGFDGMSESIFLNELSVLYAGARAGIPSPLTEPSIQYGDYAAWERERSRGRALDKPLAYWREALSDLSPWSGLQAESSYTGTQGEAGKESRDLDKAASDALRNMCRREGVTHFMAFASAFVLLLHRLCGSDDVVIGFPVAGRIRTELETLLGSFINTLPLRADLAGDPSLSELLGRTRRATLAALAHQDVPFERLVEEIRPERSLSRLPIFEFLINSHVYHQSKPEFGDLRVETFPLPVLSTAYPLTFYISSEEDRFRLEMSYHTARFSAEQIRRLLSQLAFLLEQAVTDPNRPVSQYSLVDPDSASLIPDPSAAIPEPEYPNVIEMVSEWIQRTPSAQAVTQGRLSRSYENLWADAGEVACGLREGGLNPGEVVALVGQRSCELVAGMLGVLIAGGVFLLIDPDWPRLQIETMLRQADVKHVLKVGRPGIDLQWLGELAGLRAVDARADSPLKRVSPESISKEFPVPRPNDPAYIFFTSGTTGSPEAVLGCHKGLGHFLIWQRETFQVGPGDRCSQLTGLSFDPILREIFLPLISGARICLPGADLSPASEKVLAWIDRERITVLHAVPSLVESWLARRHPRPKLRGLRWVFMAGEPLHDSLVQAWRREFPLAKAIVNLYGPTETTLVKCYYVVPTPSSPSIQPLGVPLPATQVLILNPREALCGVGEPGEIVLRTPFRTLGYLRKDSPRRSSFRPNAHTADPNDLLYWTGDRGYLRSDGMIGFLGRMDDQVKIHGARVEPDGVTAALSQLPGVLACIVVPVKDQRGVNSLVAYVVVEDRALTADRMRAQLAEKLPAAMVPTSFVFLEKLPLTRNGKVDRDALPPPIAPEHAGRSGPVLPRDRLERKLVRIWEALLEVRPIGVRDDFFDLGGHSLLAVRMFSEVERVTKRRLAVRAVFEAPTVERLAALIRSNAWTPPDTQIVSIQPTGTKPPMFWVHAAGGHVLSYRRLARYLGSDQPVYALQGVNLEEDRAVEASVEDMAARYIADLQNVQPDGPYFVGGLSFGGLVAWEIAQRLRSHGHEVSLLVLLDTRGPGHVTPHLTQRITHGLRQRLEFHSGNLSVLQPGEKLSYVFERTQGLLSRRVRVAWGKLVAVWWSIGSPTPLSVRKAYQGDIRARARYTPKPYAGRIALFRASVQPGGRGSPLMGWEGLARGTTEVYEVPGAHVSIMAEPHLEVLAAKLSECLAAAQASSSAPELKVKA